MLYFVLVKLSSYPDNTKQRWPDNVTKAKHIGKKLVCRHVWLVDKRVDFWFTVRKHLMVWFSLRTEWNESWQYDIFPVSWTDLWAPAHKFDCHKKVTNLSTTCSDSVKAQDANLRWLWIVHVTLIHRNISQLFFCVLFQDIRKTFIFTSSTITWSLSWVKSKGKKNWRNYRIPVHYCTLRRTRHILFICKLVAGYSVV